MSQPKRRDSDYIEFLIASPRSASCCEAERSQPPRLIPPSHDAYTRLLTRLEPDPDTLFREVEPLLEKCGGVLVLDDSTLDHFHARKIEPVHRHLSCKHKAVVRGINLISLVWTDGDRTLPVDYRVYDKPVDGLTKNDHFRVMVEAAARRGFSPLAVLFDSWYSGLENLKLIRDLGWVFLTRLKVNRKVDVERAGTGPSPRSPSMARRWSPTWRASARSGYSRRSPETGTLNTGRRTTWRWTSCAGWSWPSGAGRSSSTIAL